MGPRLHVSWRRGRCYFVKNYTSTIYRWLVLTLVIGLFRPLGL